MDTAIFLNQMSALFCVRQNIWLSFHVFLYACPTVISSIFGKSFHFPFPYFVLFILRYFPFHMVHLEIYSFEEVLIKNLKKKERVWHLPDPCL